TLQWFNALALVRLCATSIELPCLLEMFFSQASHAEVLEPTAQHPVIKPIVRSELISLFLIDTGLLQVAFYERRSGKLVIGQYQLRVPPHGIRPNRNGFTPVAELPE